MTLDNTAPEVTGESIDMSAVMAGDEVTISAMVSEASTVSADVSMLNAAAPTLSLMDADGMVCIAVRSWSLLTVMLPI